MVRGNALYKLQEILQARSRDQETVRMILPCPTRGSYVHVTSLDRGWRSCMNVDARIGDYAAIADYKGLYFRGLNIHSADGRPCHNVLRVSTTASEYHSHQ